MDSSSTSHLGLHLSTQEKLLTQFEFYGVPSGAATLSKRHLNYYINLPLFVCLTDNFIPHSLSYSPLFT